MQDFQNIFNRVVKEEAKALEVFSSKSLENFSNVINLILKIQGRTILAGIGKSGYIAKKIASSLASTGTPAFYIHPSEASHGDLGMITSSDVVIMLSNSGETKELSDIINYCKRFNIKIIAITMNPNSNLGKNSDFVLTIPKTQEASLLSAPTTSAVMMLALGDAMTVALHEAKGFTKDNYRDFHPGGKIGSNLLKVKALMHSEESMALIKKNDLCPQFLVIMTEKSLGCACVVDDDQNTLLGFITDGDLRRNLNQNLNSLTAEDIMTKSPLTVNSEELASKALFLMNEKSVNAMPVTNSHGKLCGIIHIHDILKAGVE